MVSLTYLGSFWRTFEILLLNREITLNLTWYASCVIVFDPLDEAETFAIAVQNLTFSSSTINSR